MHRVALPAGLLVTVLAITACSEGPIAPVPVDPSLAIMDGAHEGNQHFFFLPPMVSDPETSGDFDATLSPVVTIDDLDTSTQIAEFTMDTGPGSETVRVADDHYIVNWHTDHFDLDELHTYRITVLVDGGDLGFADVDVVTSGRELKNVDTGEFVALKDGRTLPIKFRIDEGAMAPLVASAVAAGGGHACAVGVNGKTYCWGRNDVGQLGDGSNDASTGPVAVAGDLSFDEITSGGGHTCGLTVGGEVWCWGANWYGQLGDGTTTHRNEPVRAAPSLTFESVDVGTDHTCGLATGGTAYCWGANGPFAQQIGFVGPYPLGRGQALGSFTGETCAAADPDYRGTPWDCSRVPVVVEGPEAFVSITAGLWSTCGLAASGNAYCTGWDGLEQIGDDAWANRPGMTPLAGGLSFGFVDQGAMVGCGLMGTDAYCWGGLFFDNGATGNGDQYRPNPIPPPAPPFPFLGGNAEPLPVLGGHAFASVYASDANSIFSHTCGLTTSGEAYCWGTNGVGQLGTDSALEPCRWGGGGTWACSPIPVPVAGNSRYATLATGGSFTCGIRDNGRVYCWGRNDSGQLGEGALANQFTPVLVRRELTP